MMNVDQDLAVLEYENQTLRNTLEQEVLYNRSLSASIDDAYGTMEELESDNNVLKDEVRELERDFKEVEVLLEKAHGRIEELERECKQWRQSVLIGRNPDWKDRAELAERLAEISRIANEVNTEWAIKAERERDQAREELAELKLALRTLSES